MASFSNRRPLVANLHPKGPSCLDSRLKFVVRLGRLLLASSHAGSPARAKSLLAMAAARAPSPPPSVPPLNLAALAGKRKSAGQQAAEAAAVAEPGAAILRDSFARRRENM